MPSPALDALTFEAEADRLKSCLLCGHLCRIMRGVWVECDIHPGSGRPVERVTTNYAYALRNRARMCDEFASLL